MGRDFRWILSLRWRLSFRKREQQRDPQRPRSVRPHLEQLEDRITPSGSTITPLAVFNSSSGIPLSGPILDSSGNLFGTTKNPLGGGSIFELAKGSNSITTLATLSATNDGTPVGALIMDSNGNLYGTTSVGSAGGEIYELAKGSNTITKLASIGGFYGDYPSAGLVRDNNGNLYGTTAAGGSNDDGSIFELANGSSTITTLASFTGPAGNGFDPTASALVMDSSGNLYGTADGGNSEQGTIFELAKGSNTITTLATFNGTNGSGPLGQLLMDNNGDFYGITNGGPLSVNTVYELAHGSNTITKLASISGGANLDGVIRDSSGNIFVTTAYSGSSGLGAVWELAQGSSTLTLLASFNGNNGAQPNGDLALDSNGNVFGTTDGLNSSVVYEIQGAASPVLHLAFVQQPSNTTVGATMAPVTVALEDPSGNIATSDNSDTISLALSPSGTLGGTTTMTVSGGKATFSNLAINQLGNGYTLVANTDASGGSSLTSDSFNITPAGGTTTTASDVATPFKTGSQNVTLAATVTSGTGPVNEGTVTFTVKQGNTVIGTATTSDTVSDGAASVNYALPAGQAAGNYTIEAVYNPGADFSTSSDNSHTLTVNAASTTTTANFASVPFSASAQNATLSAKVTSDAGPVNEGTVTFTVTQGGTVIGSATTSNTVSNGAASVSYALPAGQAIGNYTIEAVYNPGTDFSTSSDDTHTLGIGLTNTNTAASDVSAAFSANSQSVTLAATVTTDAGPVNDGTVTFTLMQGSTVIGTAVTSTTVSAGAASVSYTLPAGTAAGSYTIDALYNPGSGLAGSSDNTHTLTVTSKATTTTANDANATFHDGSQNVTLTATVTNALGPVNEGTVTFTLMQGSTVIGSATTSDTVSEGAASVNYALPAGTTAGSYTIDAVYNPGGDLAGSSDNTHTLTVSLASTTINADEASATFRDGSQNIMLTATVSSDAGPVNEGTVTFTLLQGDTPVGTATTSGTVANGAASVIYALPAGMPADSYTIEAVYNPGLDFTTSTDNAHTLDMGTAATTTVASNVTASFSASSQNVTLIANVTSTAGSVNEGTVTFTLLQGNTPLGTAVTSSTVSNNQATVSYVLPAGASAKNYTIDAVYNPGPDFGTSSDTMHALLLVPNNVAVTASNILALYNTNPQVVTLNAAVANISNPSTLVNEGAVTFTVQSGSATLGSVQGIVNNGNASAAFSLLAGLPAGNYNIAVSYNDSQGHFTDHTDNNAVLTVQAPSTTTTTTSPSPQQSPALHVPSLLALINEFVGGTETRNADGTVTITYSLYGIALLTANYDSAGNFASGSMLGINIPNWAWFV